MKTKVNKGKRSPSIHKPQDREESRLFYSVFALNPSVPPNITCLFLSDPKEIFLSLCGCVCARIFIYASLIYLKEHQRLPEMKHMTSELSILPFRELTCFGKLNDGLKLCFSSSELTAPKGGMGLQEPPF